MRNLIWLAVGVLVGFIAAHEVNSTAKGRAFFENVDARCREFFSGLASGYRTREAELRDPA